MKKIVSLLFVFLLLFAAIPSYAESPENAIDVNILNEVQLLALLESMKEPLASYGYNLEYSKNENGEGLLENASDYPTDYGIVVSKCTWEMNDGFYSPVIKVEVRNNTGAAAKKINLQVVFYNDDEALRYQTQCLCMAACVPYRGEHVFRNTFATNCYHKGVDVKILSRLLGHADVNITYNIYVHSYGDGFDEMYSALVHER